jgi:hypothetical protein
MLIRTEYFDLLHVLGYKLFGVLHPTQPYLSYVLVRYFIVWLK